MSETIRGFAVPLLPSTLPTAGQVIRWGLTHVELFSQWAAISPQLLAASSCHARWVLIEPLGERSAVAIDELLFTMPTSRAPETAEELRALEDELLALVNAPVEGEVATPRAPRDRKWLKAALAALKIGIPMFAPEAAQWVGVLDILAN